MEKSGPDSHRPATGHRNRSFCSCFASTWLDQIRHLHCYSAPHPAPGSRLAEADPVHMAGRPSFWVRAGRPVFGNDHFRTSAGHFVHNQGLVRTDFRAGLALVRVAESTVTALVYYQLGLFITESENILLVLIPSGVIGIPLGSYFVRRLDPETFRRICMSFDAWVVGFGFSRVLIDLKLMQSPWAYSVMAVTILVDIYLLFIFFTVQQAASRRSQRYGLC